MDQIEVIYEDDDVLVINKPAGMLVHASGRGARTDEKTVVDFLVARAPKARGVGEEALHQDGEPIDRSGVVHRLDRDTSGVMVLAKTQEAFGHLKAQFHDRQAKKEYRAFVYGTLKEKWGTIDRPIGRNARDFRLRSAQRGAKGELRPSITNWEVLAQNERFAYLKLTPKTGRMHQIRVHLKAIGKPVVGDVLYASDNDRAAGSLGFDRLALHAYALEIALPNGEQKRFEAPLPKEFLAAEAAVAA